VSDIREEFGITNPPPAGEWSWTTAISEDPRYANDDDQMATAAE